MSSANDSDPAPRGRLRQLVPVTVVLGALIAVYATGWHRDLSFQTLLEHRAGIDGFIAAHRALAILAFAALYTAAAALALPAGLFLALLGGFLFGALLGGFAAMAGSVA